MKQCEGSLSYQWFDTLKDQSKPTPSLLVDHAVSVQVEKDVRVLRVVVADRSSDHGAVAECEHAVQFEAPDLGVRGVLDDRSRGVYQGRVHVAPDAQKTDGQQMARALLLSRKAEVDAKPELEIYADDVVCAHGATVGELDATQLFYLTSRGIPEDIARGMLVEAFLIDAIETIENEMLAGLLRPVAEAWMAHEETA